MLNVNLLNPISVQRYAKFTYPHYRQQLKKINRDSSIIALGAELNSQPLGLTLAKYNPKNNKGEICSLFVAPEYRQQGIGTKLLSTLEEKLVKQNCQEISLVYIPNQTTLALKKILTNHHWSFPKPRMLICVGTRESIENAPWLNFDTRLPTKYEIFPWVELSNTEKKLIKKSQEKSPWYPEILSPFKEEHLIEPINSLGLKYKNEVVGWLITHRINHETVRYTSLFVKKELQKLGRAIPLFTKAIKLQVNKTNTSQATFTVVLDNQAMIEFVKRRIKPYLASCRQSFITSKKF
ncbi:MAG: GNAT family N-acetyltransferase [Crocosphaera sp.]